MQALVERIQTEESSGSEAEGAAVRSRPGEQIRFGQGDAMLDRRRLRRPEGNAGGEARLFDRDRRIRTYLLRRDDRFRGDETAGHDSLRPGVRRLRGRHGAGGRCQRRAVAVRARAVALLLVALLFTGARQESAAPEKLYAE